MFKILGRTSGNFVDIAVEEELTADDFSRLRDKLDPLIESHGKVRILFDLSRLARFEGEALWDESSFDDHARVERVAVIAPFSLGADETRAFPPECAEEAWSWASQPIADGPPTT